ncbi:MAG TPA: hypothetical protein VH020_10135 [Stellaceae bacterium]|jgi:hypothetical protein|nr:hypothetical protein [Stellaceae bacterium]
MCDYSLRVVASRPAKSGDRLVLSKFNNTITRGFSAVGDGNTAVCLLPGTQFAFEEDVAYERRFFLLGVARKNMRVATFVKTAEHIDATHHDALEFPNGKIVLLMRLCEGQVATVLQLPAGAAGEASRSVDHGVAAAA